ncbi:MAG: universal stress protein [Thermodesulfobacteriota bacterium]
MIPKIKKILYATDLSENSSYAFLYATDMARRYDATIIILHAIQPVPPYVYYEGGLAYDTLDRVKEEEQKVDTEKIKERLQIFCRKAESQMGPPCVELVSKILVPVGYPVEEILKMADEEGCDAIVLGTHGKGFLKQTFLGSVAGSVLQRTRKPVFIVPLPAGQAALEWDGM